MSKEYDKYLNAHILNVKICYKLLTGETLEMHDKSKFIKEIYNAYDKHWYGTEKEKSEYKNQYNYAWLFHQNKEAHHWQFWVLLKDSGEQIPLKMPERYVNEMIADWAAFSLKKKTPSELSKWYSENKNNMKLHPETRKKVEELIPVMEEKLAEYLKD